MSRSSDRQQCECPTLKRCRTSLFASALISASLAECRIPSASFRNMCVSLRERSKALQCYSAWRQPCGGIANFLRVLNKFSMRAHGQWTEELRNAQSSLWSLPDSDGCILAAALTSSSDDGRFQGTELSLEKDIRISSQESVFGPSPGGLEHGAWLGQTFSLIDISLSST